jgi:hypothetical protein
MVVIVMIVVVAATAVIHDGMNQFVVSVTGRWYVCMYSSLSSSSESSNFISPIASGKMLMADGG